MTIVLVQKPRWQLDRRVFIYATQPRGQGYWKKQGYYYEKIGSKESKSQNAQDSML